MLWKWLLSPDNRHIDCAAIYRNEAEVGAGIRKANIPREQTFITTKLWNIDQHSYEEVESALDRSLRQLGLDHVDLYLIHWPVEFVSKGKWFPLDERGVFQATESNIPQLWSYMERLLTTGKSKAIGVSNFNVRRLEELLQTCKVNPAANQIEIHPYLQQPDLIDFCWSHNILLEAYSPLGNNQTGEPKTVDDVEVHAVARSLSMDPGQVLVSWGVQRGWVVLPKSVTEKRIVGNFQDQVLPRDAMERLDNLQRHKRFNFPARWGVNIYDESDEAELEEVAVASGEENKTKFSI